MKGPYITVSLLLSTLTMTGCALMDSNNGRISQQDDEYATYAAQKNGTAEALDQLGWTPSQTLTSEERDTLNRRIRLNRLEQSLVSEKEREQYFNYRPYLDNDDDKMAFLSLPNMEARDRFAMDKGIYFHANKFTPVVRDAVSHSDIILGMNKEAVVESWGEPEAREVAGESMYGNEKWVYTDYVPSSEGYEKEERIVIFEGGKVVGWQRQ